MGLAAVYPDRADIAVQGEFPFTWAHFHQLAGLVRDEAGIMLPDSKATLVYSRLSKRLRECGLNSFQDYCTLVEQNGEERQALIAAMTTNVTRFFREPHHFDHLRATVLPGLIAAARKGVRVRIWSSACSSGEEPYSLALTLLAMMPDAANHDILILASDIDPNMVAAGKAAQYPLARLNDIPKELQLRNLESDGSRFRFNDGVRAVVRFKQLNLLKDWPMKGPFDVIFCRNVMIYFDQPTQDGIWDRFGRLMPVGGHLYIGHSERIALPQFPLVAQTVYRRAQ